MKLVRFLADNGAIHCGVVKGKGVVDLQKAGSQYNRVIDIVAAGDDALNSLASTVANCQAHVNLDDIRLVTPIERPGKYLAIGMNYRKHRDEALKLGVVGQEHQVWFNKQTTCISGPFTDIDPGVTEMLDYEVELGVIIGRTAKGVQRSDAYKHVFGYLVANDVSARDWQFHTPTFTMGKSFDTHGPIGPWIITADEVDNPQNLNLQCYVNGQLRQSSNTSEMVHDIPAQIEYLSTAFTLEPGDIIATGTPEGVGVAMSPPVFLQPGDVIRCEIEGIGAIENRVRSRSPLIRREGLHNPERIAPTGSS